MHKLHSSKVDIRPAIGYTGFIYFPPTNCRPVRYRFLPWTKKVSTCLKALFSTPVLASTFDSPQEIINHSELSDKSFGPEDFVEVAQNLRSNSALGLDGATAVLLKKNIVVLSVAINLMWHKW